MLCTHFNTSNLSPLFERTVKTMYLSAGYGQHNLFGAQRKYVLMFFIWVKSSLKSQNRQLI